LNIGPNAIGSGEIINGAVGTDELASGAVTNAKLANGAVSYLNISSTAVGTGSNQLARGDHGHSNYAGSTHYHSFSIASGGAHSHVGASGAHTHTGNTGAPLIGPLASSRRFKTDISSYMPEDLQKVLQLQLVKYKYHKQWTPLNENREWSYGYIAEDVEDLGIKEIVGYDDKMRPNSINYGLLSTLVLEIVKVQQSEIDSLKQQLAKLMETK